MQSLAKLYGKNFHQQTENYYANWLPNTVTPIGTVGTLDDRFYFSRLGTLADFGIAFDPVADVETNPKPSPFALQTSKSTHVTTQLAADVQASLPSVPAGKAGFGLAIDEQGGFIIRAAESYETHLRSLLKLEASIKAAQASGQWHKDYVVVSAIVQAPYADILIAQSAGSNLEVQVSAEGQAGPLELGSASLGLVVKKESGAVLNLLGSQNVTLALQLVKLHGRLFRSPELGPVAFTINRQPTPLLDKPADLMYLDIA